MRNMDDVKWCEAQLCQNKQHAVRVQVGAFFFLDDNWLLGSRRLKARVFAVMQWYWVIPYYSYTIPIILSEAIGFKKPCVPDLGEREEPTDTYCTGSPWKLLGRTPLGFLQMFPWESLNQSNETRKWRPFFLYHWSTVSPPTLFTLFIQRNWQPEAKPGGVINSPLHDYHQCVFSWSFSSWVFHINYQWEFQEPKSRYLQYIRLL